MTHNTPAPVADKALAERLARLKALADHPDQSPCDAIRYDQECGDAHRSGQLITLAEAQAMVAAALRVHAGRCEEGESITEKYLRRYPRSKKTRSWAGAMVHMRTMNGIWKPDGHGYTINFAEAWVLPLEQARKTVSGIYEDHGGTYYRASAAAIRAAATGTKEGM